VSVFPTTCVPIFEFWIAAALPGSKPNTRGPCLPMDSDFPNSDLGNVGYSLHLRALEIYSLEGLVRIDLPHLVTDSPEAGNRACEDGSLSSSPTLDPRVAKFLPVLSGVSIHSLHAT